MDRKRFFTIARSSLVEIDTQLEIAMLLKYLPIEDSTQIDEKINHLFAMLSNSINKSK